jgi:predicted nucleotide-binding protein
MIERFQGGRDCKRLIEVIKRQAIVRDDEALAMAICDVLELKEFAAGEQIITQGHSDDDLYLIFVGRVSIVVNGREVAVRHVAEHVGEMALIEPTAPRSASVFAIEQTVIGKITETAFSRIAEEFPSLWRRLALDLGNRLRQRNELVVQRNPRPVIFIGSSVESLAIAREIQSGFRHDDFIVRPWTDKVFGASSFPIEDLEQQVRTSDFAILVLGPDDRVISRGRESSAPRDNVIFELGHFMGALTRHRTFLVLPRGADLKIPSDLMGLTPLEYSDGSPGDLPSRIGPVCNDLRMIINSKGPK